MDSGAVAGRRLLVWIDAQLPPQVVAWLDGFSDVEADHVADLGLLRATDLEIWEAARATAAVVLTKDADFRDRVLRYGSPPQSSGSRLATYQTVRSGPASLRCGRELPIS